MKILHKQDCKMVFGRKDSTCPRCQELIAGAKPRQGWNDQKKRDEAQRLKLIKEHDCQKQKCGPVCTAFDY